MKIRIILIILILLAVPFSSHAETSKRIHISLSAQRLTYFEGDRMIDSFLISSGLPRTPSPRGTFAVQAKLPVVKYFGYNRDGSTYNYPNTKWNLRFYRRYYIHGAYWHNAFGTPRSHGCINVSYENMEKLYHWADVGTKVTIGS